MAVREALLGILTIGPAYGLQLHYELGARAPHRVKTNVGQIYATLERLSKAALVTPAGTNAEGLPLWQLTEAGRADALRWLRGADINELPEWNDVLDMVLVSRSVNASAAEGLITALATVADRQPATSGSELADAAAARYRHALQGWLGDAAAVAGTGEIGFQLARPKRGRPARGNLALSSPKGQTA
jgi:DNA-binding PadR family transcriptional regulator